MKQQGWPERLVAVIATEIRRQREKRDLSAQKLSDRCTELGYPIARNTLSNLENGRREAITVAELFVLADALGLPPLHLVFPVGQVETVEVVPGVELSPLRGFQWVGAGRGHGKYRGRDYREEVRTLDRYRLHDFALGKWQSSQRKLAELTVDTEEAEADRKHYRREASEAENVLAYLRWEMRDAGQVLPSVPELLASSVEQYTDAGSGIIGAEQAAVWNVGEILE